jgi:hypothetical protein
MPPARRLHDILLRRHAGLRTTRSADVNVSACDRRLQRHAKTLHMDGLRQFGARIRKASHARHGEQFGAANPLLAAPAMVTRLSAASNPKSLTWSPQLPTEASTSKTEQSKDDSDDHEARDLLAAPADQLEMWCSAPYERCVARRSP